MYNKLKTDYIKEYNTEPLDVSFLNYVLGRDFYDFISYHNRTSSKVCTENILYNGN